MLTRILAAFALVASATVMAVFGLAGRSRLSGPILFTLTASHGVHRDDLVIAGCWTLTLFIASVLVVWRR